MEHLSYDYIIVGAGIGGTVVASRLASALPSLKILLLEAGADESQNPDVSSPMNTALLKDSVCDWSYYSVPQQHLGGCVIYNGGGKGLGGGSIINKGLWHRGERRDYDAWAHEVGDDRWSYEGLLPYFRKSESHYDIKADPQHHGFDGPVPIASVTSSARVYALAKPLKETWLHLGVEQVLPNTGDSIGLTEIIEARDHGSRVIASSVYPLSGVTVKTHSLVSHITFSPSQRATGVELLDGTIFQAHSEVILCAGAIRTPQILLLSGIGPAEQLEAHDIPQRLASPHVGRNLWDHLIIRQFHKLRDPSLGASVGSPAFPMYTSGNPIDWWVSHSVPEPLLKVAMAIDDVVTPSLLGGPRAHLAIFHQYLGSTMPLDGTEVSSVAMLSLPTSRGTVTLRSRNPQDNPVTDPNFYATELDRARMRAAVRLLDSLTGDTEEGQELFEQSSSREHSCSDDELDKRVSEHAGTLQHPSGTASMGKAVDTDLRVIGIDGLRVVDASIIPVPISAPIQPCVYAIAEQAAEIIMRSREDGLQT